MQRNYIENASDFFSFYQTIEMQNFGLNVFFLTLLQNSSYENLNEFLNLNREELSKINLVNYINNMADPTFDFPRYLKTLKKIGPKHNTAIDEEKLSHARVNDIICYILDNDPQSIGHASAMFFDTELLSWKDDILIRLYLSERRSAYYKIDDEFPHWPINQIGNYPIYAAKGFTEKDSRFLPQGFYDELLNSDHHNQTNIQSIIALGELNVDFPSYFIKPYEYKTIDLHGNESKIEVNSRLANTGDSTPYSQYLLHVKSIQSSNNTPSLIHEKTFRLFHIPIADGQIMDLQHQGLASIIDKVSDDINNKKGVLVHCRAGFGRTGQVITELILSRENNLQDLFNTEDRQQILGNINQFVDGMRECRPGLIITQQQLFQALHNAVRYRELKIQEENLNHEKILNSTALESSPKAAETVISNTVKTSFFDTAKSTVCCESSFWRADKPVTEPIAAANERPDPKRRRVHY